MEYSKEQQAYFLANAEYEAAERAISELADGVDWGSDEASDAFFDRDDVGKARDAQREAKRALCIVENALMTWAIERVCRGYLGGPNLDTDAKMLDQQMIHVDIRYKLVTLAMRLAV